MNEKRLEPATPVPFPHLCASRSFGKEFGKRNSPRTGLRRRSPSGPSKAFETDGTRRYRVQGDHSNLRCRCFNRPWRDLLLACHRLGACAQDLRISVLCYRVLEPRHQEVRRSCSCRGHANDIFYRDVHRCSGRARHRNISDRALSASFAAADRHRDRTSRGHSQHHLWDLGLVRLRTFPPAIYSASSYFDVQGGARLVKPVCRAALRNWRPDGEPHSGDYGLAFHHGYQPGRLRDSAGHA